MARHLMCVFSNPVSGREDEFNKWYDEVHIPEVLKFPAFMSGQRFKVCDTQPSGTEQPVTRYLCIYELEVDDIDAFIKMTSKAKGDENSPLDMKTMQRLFLSNVGSRQTSSKSK